MQRMALRDGARRPALIVSVRLGVSALKWLILIILAGFTASVRAGHFVCNLLILDWLLALRFHGSFSVIRLS